VFLVFVKLVMGEKLGWNHYAGFAMVLVGVALVFNRWQPAG
jgi:drug/metabolite transporter (DMT)-like permease